MMFKQASLGVRVILKPQIETMSKGGIAIARDERTQAINTDKGVVVMVGPQAWYDLPEKPDIKAGDLVMYSHYGAKTVKDDQTGEYFIICNDQDILVGYTNE